MKEIECNQELKMTNVLFYHGWVTREQVNEVFVRAEELMNKHEVKKNGDVVTATREIEMREGQPVMNLEVGVLAAAGIVAGSAIVVGGATYGVKKLCEFVGSKF